MKSVYERVAHRLRQPVSFRPIARAMVSGPMAATAGIGLLTISVLIVLHILIDRTAWHFEHVPDLFRYAILGSTVWQSLPLLVLVAVLVQGARNRHRFVRWTAVALVSGVFYVWFSSWAIFAATGQFLNRDSFVLAMASPASMFYHLRDFAPAQLILIPLAAIAFGSITMPLARWTAGADVLARIALILSFTAVLLTGKFLERSPGAAFNRDNARVGHPDGGNSIRMSELYALAHEDRSGPVTHLRSELERDQWIVHASKSIAVEWRDRPDSVVTPEPRARFNVVVLVIESLRSDELRAYGSELSVMPKIDALSLESAVFLDHYAVATHSNYGSVVPISSQFPLRDEATHIYPRSPSYPRVHLYDVLKPHGYRTAIVSSQNETWGGMLNFLSSPNLDYFLHSETYSGPTYVDERDVGFAKYVRLNGHAGKIDDRNTIEEAIRWIGGGQSQQPFVMYVNLQNSHVPYPIPADAPTPFGPRTPSFPIGFNHFPRDSAQVVRGVYRNALHYVDAQVGRLIDYLKESGRWEQTIFVVTGDHGQAFYEHGFAAHSNELFDELLRTPLLIKAPGLKAGVRTGLAQHVDIAPTVLDLLGMPAQPFQQGISLLDGSRQFAYAVVQTSLANQYGIISGTKKLVVDVRRESVVLRDLADDPMELVDLSATLPGVVTDLRKRLDTWRAVQLRYYHSPGLQARFFAPVLPP